MDSAGVDVLADGGGEDTQPNSWGTVPMRSTPPDARPFAASELPVTRGDPKSLGCADGTREGFLDPRGWRDIAGCAGAFSVKGLLSRDALMPGCAYQAGNTGENPMGVGCSVADLCAQGWHVCRNAEEVASASPTDCESAADPEHPQFFLVRAGASSQGVCAPVAVAANDLHGCGTLGQPESEACQPLERRLSFADCAASSGAWICGGADDPHNEANLVHKPLATLGGALCCRDK